MMIIFFKYFFLCFLLFFTSCASREKQIKKAELYHQLAHSYMKKCQYPAALGELEKALEIKPKQPVFHHSIALLYFQFKKYDKSIHHFKEALRINPKFTDARVHLGRSLIEVNQWEKGVKELKKAQEDLTYRYPENVHTHLGVAYYNKKNFSQAKKHFSIVRTVKKEDCSIALYHAKSLFYMEKFQKALDILEPAKLWCETNPPLCSAPTVDSYYFAALIYFKKGHKEKAISHLKIFLNKAKESVHLEDAKKKLKFWKEFS